MLLVVLLLLLLRLMNAFKAIPRLNGVCYVKEGDINIGVFNTISRKGMKKYCSEELLEPTRTQYPEVTKYAIAEINNSTKILPNISLGYVMIDTCTTDLVALARTLSFITGPAQTVNTEHGPDLSSMSDSHIPGTSGTLYNGTMDTTFNTTLNMTLNMTLKTTLGNSPPEDNARVDNCSDGKTSYKVAGILGPWMSSSSVMAAPLLRYTHFIIFRFYGSPEHSNNNHFFFGKSKTETGKMETLVSDIKRSSWRDPLPE